MHKILNPGTTAMHHNWHDFSEHNDQSATKGYRNKKSRQALMNLGYRVDVIVAKSFVCEHRQQEKIKKSIECNK
jgi:hypothetical protein